MATTPTLPPDIISEILSFLPSKTLIRLKLLSKSIHSLIESKPFITLHLNRTTTRLLVITHNAKGHHIHPLDSLPRPINLWARPIKFFGPDILEQVGGSCRGLLCIHSSVGDFLLYNPTTRTRFSFPHFPVEGRTTNNEPVGEMYVSSGFGYDEKGDDYKVVLISCVKRQLRFRVRVCGVRERVWRVTDTGYFIYAWCHVAFVSGGLHWIGAEKCGSDLFGLVIRFDIHDEKFTLVELPDFGVDGKEEHMVGLGELGGCLSLIRMFGLTRNETWVLKEYGVKESWTKMLTSSVSPPSSPVYLSRDGSKVLLETGCRQLSWYDLERKTWSNVDIEGVGAFFTSLVCLESLILLEETAHKDVKKSKMQDKEVKNWKSD